MGCQSEIFCLDPGLKVVDYQACSEMADLADSFSYSFSHHLPAVKGMKSVYQREKEVKVSALIVLGSVASVNSNAHWQKEFHSWLYKKIKESVPTLGICYGHQAIAKLFGGEVDYIMPTKEKFFGFRSFKILDSCPLDLPKKIEVVASHEEEVKKLPKELKVFASSQNVPIDGFYHESLPTVTFQSHPEAREDFCSDRGISHKVKADPFQGGRSIMSSFMKYVKSLEG